MPTNRLEELVALDQASRFKLQIYTILGEGTTAPGGDKPTDDFLLKEHRQLTRVKVKYLRAKKGLKTLDYFFWKFKREAPEVADIFISKLDIIEPPNVRMIFVRESSHPEIWRTALIDGKFPGISLYELKKKAAENLLLKDQKGKPKRNITGLISKAVVGPHLKTIEDENVFISLQENHPYFNIVVPEKAQYDCRDYRLKFLKR